MPSPFFTRNTTAEKDSLALLQLRRDQIIPTILRDHDDENQGYWEGKVTNTRFGSFPHSTLIGQPWGTQVGASKVDTGSRGRKSTKRKAEELDASATTPSAEEETNKKPSLRAPVAADSGFLHILAPTPEAWTISLPHRTQVVYTPDYSYILHRLRARPGSTVIEAGAGSGSFTHAAARAVFNGYPEDAEQAPKRRRFGKVCSYEFHELRVGKVQQELRDHGLDGMVEATHRDVYEDGFLLGDPVTGKSPKANAIFLDLPAPWLALKHLVRNPPDGRESALDPESPVYLCTFSPCLEQAERTIRTMRQLSWLNISMVEVAQRRIDVKRERVGLDTEGVRGATTFPKTVEEAVAKLRSDEQRAKLIRDHRQTKDEPDYQPIVKETPFYKERSNVPLYAQGRLTHRSEPDLRTHTSYLVFAILPRSWSEEDEQKCRKQWPSAQIAKTDNEPPLSKKQMKKQAAIERAKLKEAERLKAQQEQSGSGDKSEEAKVEEQTSEA